MSFSLSLRALLLLAGLIAAGAGVLYAWSTSTHPPSPPSIHELVLPDVEGRDRAIREWEGKTLLINFWATWCAPCREEIPLLQEAQARYANRGLRVIGVAIDDPSEVITYRREMDIRYPVLLGDFATLSLTAPLGNTSEVLPFTLILSPQGQIVARKVGSYRKSELTALLADILPPASTSR